jgi:DNA-binding CsgD family transcriptional regulator
MLTSSRGLPYNIEDVSLTNALMINPPQKKRISRVTPLARANFEHKPLTKRQLDIFTQYESGKTQQEIASGLGVNQSYISHTLRIYAQRYRTNKEYLKLNNINILQAKIAEKRDKPSQKDVVDIVETLENIIEPRKINHLEFVDKKLEINLNEFDALSHDDKMERVRRALSDGYAN